MGTNADRTTHAHHPAIKIWSPSPSDSSETSTTICDSSTTTDSFLSSSEGTSKSMQGGNEGQGHRHHQETLDQIQSDEELAYRLSRLREAPDPCASESSSSSDEDLALMLHRHQQAERYIYRDCGEELNSNANTRTPYEEQSPTPDWNTSYPAQARYDSHGSGPKLSQLNNNTEMFCDRTTLLYDPVASPEDLALAAYKNPNESLPREPAGSSEQGEEDYRTASSGLPSPSFEDDHIADDGSSDLSLPKVHSQPNTQFDRTSGHCSPIHFTRNEPLDNELFPQKSDPERLSR